MKSKRVNIALNGIKTWSFYCRKHSESVGCRDGVVGIAPRYGLAGSGFETLSEQEVFCCVGFACFLFSLPIQTGSAPSVGFCSTG